mmetsp:Transcript_65873/g.212484  ORF Transcript_65873/g.212484 Transcript_65873/m.212484 type:complete len:329 (+) Transcript_65873:328-1314(+)
MLTSSATPEACDGVVPMTGVRDGKREAGSGGGSAASASPASPARAMKCLMTASPCANCLCTAPCSRSSSGSSAFQPWYHCSTSPKSQPRTWSHLPNAARHCGKRATSSTRASPAAGSTPIHASKSSSGVTSWPSGCTGIPEMDFSSLASTFSTRGSQLAASSTSLQGPNTSRAEPSRGSQRSKHLLSLKRMGAQRHSKRAPNTGSHGWIHMWMESLSTRGSHASTSTRKRGSNTCTASVSNVDPGSTLWQHSNSRKHGSTSRADHLHRAERSGGKSTASHSLVNAGRSSPATNSLQDESDDRPRSASSNGCHDASSCLAHGTANAKAT